MVSVAEERTRLAAVGLTLRHREQWGARFDYTNTRPVDEPATRLFLHITVTNPGSYPSNDAHWRGVEAIGISRFPNTGISYNGGLLPGGVLYEGQPWGRRGAHTVNDYQLAACTTTRCPGRGQPLTAPSWNLNVNARALAVARNLGDPVTDADVRSAAMWAAGYKLAGLATRSAYWHGHRCATAKDCPGANAWARLDDISDLTADYVRTGLPGTPATPEDDMPAPKDWDAQDWAAFNKNVAATVHNLQLGRRTLDDGTPLTLSTALARAYDNTVTLVDALDDDAPAVPVSGKVHVAGDLFVTPPEEPT